MSNTTAANAAKAAAASTVGATSTSNGDDSASTITVNTKAPPAAAAGGNFPPPKTDKPRPHVCATCQRSFARLEHLKRHERSHTKEKPFECPECTRCFARRDLLLRHQQKLHQTTTPSSRPRNRRESTSGVTPAQSRRKNSVASINAAAAGGAQGMRPRANTISHVDGTAMQMINSANASVARGMAHSRHQSLVGLPMHNLDHIFGMSAVLNQRGMQHGLPKLETGHLNNGNFASNGLRTAPAMAFNPDFDFDSVFFGGGSTINPNALHYNDSPQSMMVDQTSPFGAQTINDVVATPQFEDGLEFLTGFEHQMSFNANENVIDGSSPSAISTTSQSGISDVMVDGSNHPAPAGTSTMWQPSVMGPPQMPNPFAMEMNGSVFPDLLNGAPLSPQPASQKINDPYFSTPPPSLSSLSPSVAVSGLNTQNLNQTLNFNAGPETPSSLNGGNHGASPVTTITDSTRTAIVTALSQCLPFGGRKYSFTSQGSPQSPQFPTFSSGNASSPQAGSLPSTQDLQRFVGAYLTYFHPHLPFLHIPTLSFDLPSSASGRSGGSGVGGSSCLILSMAAIGALYELEHAQSKELFDMAKRMVFFYLEERRKTDARRPDVRRSSHSVDPHQQSNDNSASHTPVWLVQAMLLNVVYGHNCADKTASDIASTHCAALVSLAQGAELLRPDRVDGTEQDESGWGRKDLDEHAEWIKWKTMEERKRTLYAVFVMSSLLVAAYNHNPAVTNSEIFLDLPCDEEFFAAESGAIFAAKGGAQAANHNRTAFYDSLGELLRTNERQQSHLAAARAGAGQQFGSPAMASAEAPLTTLKPSTFGCMVLIYALHNYIWETRQRHHNRVWTNEETDKMHRHIEAALKGWQAAWSSNPQHSIERPNPFGLGPMSADSIPLLDLAYVKLFVNLSRSKEKFWQRDWDGMVEELASGSEIIQHAEHDPDSNMESPSGGESMQMSSGGDSPVSPTTTNPSARTEGGDKASGAPGISRREKHLRKAAFYAVDSLAMSDKLGVTFADFTSRELPLQAALCTFDCAQVVAEWVTTLQERVGPYLGVLGQDPIDFGQVPAIILLEEDDVRLLAKVRDVLSSAEMKISMSMSMGMGGGLNGGETFEGGGYASKLLRVTARMMDKAAVWPVTRLMAQSLETHANHTRGRAEKSALAVEPMTM